MKKTATQFLKQVIKEEPIEVLKTATSQIAGQRKSPPPVGKGSPAGFAIAQKRIQGLQEKDNAQSGKKIADIREQLGTSTPSEKTSNDQVPQSPEKKAKAPAISSPYTVSLEEQVEVLRKKVKGEEEEQKAKQQKEVAEKKKQEELAKQNLQMPASAPRRGSAPFARKLKSSQGVGETRPSFGKQ